jgi:MarR family transcriptional regulator, organic hydroperoxide resistance regulator
MKKDKANFYYEKEIAKIVGVMHRKLTRYIYAVFVKGQLSLSHIIAMEFLDEKKKANMSELSGVLNLTMGASTSVVDKLAALKLAQRRHLAKDRRVVEVLLTRKGENLIKKVIKHRLDMVNNALSVLSEKDKEAYFGLLKKIYAGLKDEK